VRDSHGLSSAETATRPSSRDRHLATVIGGLLDGNDQAVRVDRGLEGRLMADLADGIRQAHRDLALGLALVVSGGRPELQ
jgi:hypothetical protein